MLSETNANICLSAWTMMDYDATAHIAEEAKDPARIVPKAIASALTFTYVVGWLFNIVLVFCMGDPAVILASDIGQPVRFVTGLKTDTPY